MAYITEDGKGPYPCDAGEYCGNHMPACTPLGGSKGITSPYETYEQARAAQAAYLTGMRFGRPRSCPAGSSEWMASQGYVGLYLKESRPLNSWEKHIPTPPELREPDPL